MNPGLLWIIVLFGVVAVYLLWMLFKPKKTERKRFSLRERRMQREEERENAKED
jgi:beta-lactam-binding protein with PASTA domain